MKASGKILIIEFSLAIATKIKIKAKKNDTSIFPIIGTFLKIFEYTIKKGQLIKIIKTECIFKKNESINANTIIEAAIFKKKLNKYGY